MKLMPPDATVPRSDLLTCGILPREAMQQAGWYPSPEVLEAQHPLRSLRPLKQRDLLKH